MDRSDLSLLNSSLMHPCTIVFMSLESIPARASMHMVSCMISFAMLRTAFFLSAVTLFPVVIIFTIFMAILAMCIISVSVLFLLRLVPLPIPSQRWPFWEVENVWYYRIYVSR